MTNQMRLFIFNNTFNFYYLFNPCLILYRHSDLYLKIKFKNNIIFNLNIYSLHQLYFRNRTVLCK